MSDSQKSLADSDNAGPILAPKPRMGPMIVFAGIAEAALKPDETRFVNSLGRDVCFRHMTGSERDKHEASMMTKGEVDPAKLFGVRQRYLAITLSDGQGNPIATAEQISKLPAEVIDEMADLAREVNGIGDGAKDKAGNDSAPTQG